MTTIEPSGQNVWSPKIRNEALVRKFIAQNGTGYSAIAITDGASFVDPDADSLTFTVYFDDVTTQFPPSPPGTQVLSVTSGEISKESTGHYYYNIGTANTKYRGLLTMVWTYTINSVPYTFTDFGQIQSQMPLYESLRETERSIIDEVSWMLGDLFDSTDGGPSLIEPFQTHFNFERIAQMEKLAVYRMNHIGFPVRYWGIGPNTDSVPREFHGLLVIGTYLECMRHLIASYTEIPLFQGSNITYTDRRDYSQRWQTIFSTEWPEYVTYVKMGKRKLLNLGRGALLVGGGIYGGNAMGIFQAGTYASQVRSWRFYPAAPALSWGASSHGSGFPSAL